MICPYLSPLFQPSSHGNSKKCQQSVAHHLWILCTPVDSRLSSFGKNGVAPSDPKASTRMAARRLTAGTPRLSRTTTVVFRMHFLIFLRFFLFFLCIFLITSAVRQCLAIPKLFKPWDASGSAGNLRDSSESQRRISTPASCNGKEKEQWEERRTQRILSQD